MALKPAMALHGLHLAVLRCASLLVPGRRRGEWWREWRSELWHVRQACIPEGAFSFEAERDVAMFCIGAFQDALCLRGFSGQGRALYATTKGSATQCLFMLAGLIAASYGVGLLLPGVAAVRHSPRYRDAQNLMLIQGARNSGDSTPTISAEQYRSWARRRQDLFDGFAFYRVKQVSATIFSQTQNAGTIAIASPNLFALLGLPVRFAPAESETHSDVTRLILSDETWKREFGGDPHIFGQTIRVGLNDAVVGGVAPEGSWRLPGKVDGWLLAPDADSRSNGAGFVVAHLKPSSLHSQWGGSWWMSAPTPDGSMADFFCAALTERTRGPGDIFLFAVFLACLALPATTSLPLGEYRVSSQKLPWARRLRRWGFLGGKIGLLLILAYFASLDLAHLRTAVDPVSSVYIQIAATFSICLFGLRWLLRDQRQRCPVCLRRLTHPARVGQPSRNFLAWNGTELICVGGHGLLHIPEIQTSWFNTQRWLYLDPSWEGLFAEAGLASASYF